MNKLLIIDGNSIANRAFYAMPYLSNHKGQPSGAVFGFANIIIKIIQMVKPSHVAVAFDHARKTFRNKIYAEYKGTRKPMPEELAEQFPVIKEMLGKMKIPCFEFENIEADDIIGTISRKADCQKIILSGDKDLFQLIGDQTFCYFTRKGVTDIIVFDRETLKHEMGIEPWQIIELKSLMGDASDNIPGIKGIGEKTAHTLLEKYHSLENILAHTEELTGKLKENIINGKEQGRLSHKLATIKTDCDFDFSLEDCKLVFPFGNQVYKFFTDMDFSSLLRNSNIFSPDAEIQTTAAKEYVRKPINSMEVISHILEQPMRYFAYCIDDMTFAIDDTCEYYLTQNYDMFSGSMTIEDVLTLFKPIFENSKIVKLTKSLKNDMHVLQPLSIEIVNAFDIEIANYVTTAGIKFERKLSVCDYIQEKDRLESLMKEQGTDKVFRDIEMPLVKILKEMEENGFKINKSKLDELGKNFQEKLDKLEKSIYQDAGMEFNINSPKQVAYVLYDVLGIKAYNNKKGSTSVDVLDELRYIPIVDNLLEYRKFSKLVSSYIDVYKKITQELGDIIHTTFNQTQTNTGRLSSSEPNLQTIPTRDDEGRELRKLFISKFKGGSLVSGDYNQIELRLLAHMSGEEELIKAYNEGKDIHATTAAQIFGVNIKDVTPTMRREAKAVNFGIIYGISKYGLSQSIKTSQDNAKKYIENYFSRYPKVKEFMDNNVAYAQKHGQIETMFGRIRKIPEISSSKFQLRNFGQRVAMNMPLQGSASDIIKIAMLKVYNALNEKGLKSQLILQIHDELIIDVFPGEEKIVEKLLKEEMENVASLKVPLVVSISSGKDLFECK